MQRVGPEAMFLILSGTSPLFLALAMSSFARFLFPRFLFNNCKDCP